MNVDAQVESRLEEVLERAARFFEDHLWESHGARAARAGLNRKGLEVPILRAFGVGYAPIGPKELLDHLGEGGFSTEELRLAGIATRSRRGHWHTSFRSRVMFPIRDRGGRIIGFAGLGTHLGPSWPLWVVSPETSLHQRAKAIFALDRAAPAIARSSRVQVLGDCLEVLQAHQRGEQDAVAVHTAELSREQVEQLAADLPGGAEGLELMIASGRRGRKRRPPTPIRPAAEGDGTPALAAGSVEAAESDPVIRRATPHERIAQVVAAAVIGLGVPLGWQAAFQPGPRPQGGTSEGLAMTFVAVGASYFLLALMVAAISARVRSSSHARRMRLPWLIGVTEWQPSAWTYHLVERVLIGAAVLSTAVCVFWWTVGGFFG